MNVAPAAWRAATAGLVLPAQASACVVGWAERGRPAIVRRRLAGEGADIVPLAIQLPNAYARLRLAVAVAPSAVVPRAPVSLAEAASSAPAAWTDVVAAVLDLARDFGMPHVYGGLLWQHLTGEPVLRQTSDLDLLWDSAPHRRGSLVNAMARLDGIPRLDGEIVLEDGGGVSWRELQAARDGGAQSVAVKTLDRVSLREVETILRDPVPC